MATGGTGATRASLRLLSPSVPTLGSGSGGRLRLRLRSDGQGRASLSGLPDVEALARRAVSRSGGGQRLAAASEPDGLLAPRAAEQPASVSASAGHSSSSVGGGVGVGRLRPLSAELGLSPLCFSGPGGACCCWVVLGQAVEPQRLLDQPRLQTIRPLMVTSVTVVTVIVIEAVSVSVSVISAGTLSVSALVIPVVSVAVVTVTLVMTVMALVPGVVLLRCYVHLCVCFWSALLSGLSGLWGGGGKSFNENMPTY